MIINTTQLIIAVIRAVLVTTMLYFFGERFNKYVDSSPRHKILYRWSRKDKKFRELIVKYYWAVGLLVFIINILILYLI